MRGPRARYRKPAYATGCTAERSDARLDAVRIKFETNFVRGVGNRELISFLMLLVDDDLFKASRQIRRNKKLDIKDTWLFGGHIKFHSAREQQTPFTITLELNLSRFLAHVTGSIDDLQDVPPQELLRRNNTTSDQLKEQTLDNQNNFLTPQRWGEAADQYSWFIFYLRKVTELVTGTIHFRASGGANLEEVSCSLDDVTVSIPWSDGVISRTEAYWEYRVPDAVSFVHQLWPHMNALCDALLVTEFPSPTATDTENPRVRYRTRFNSLSLIADLGRANLELAIYGKSPKSIRFEVRYKSSLRGFISRNDALGSGERNLDNICHMISLGMDDAGRRLNMSYARCVNLAYAPKPHCMFSPSWSSTSASRVLIKEYHSSICWACSFQIRVYLIQMSDIQVSLVSCTNEVF